MAKTMWRSHVFRHILLQLRLQMLLSTPEARAGNCKNKGLGEI